MLLLPPWEGYDEFAHYSYAQQLADTGTAPSLQEGRLSTDVEAYRRATPTPYSTTPPFDENEGWTYRQWFGRDTTPRTHVHVQPLTSRAFSPGEASNWQAQHPPLYYSLLAPLVAQTAGLSWAGQLLVLRLASWTVAFAGFAVSILATRHLLRRRFPDLERDFFLISGAWALVFPGFFPEFARLGNDSLVLLLLGLAWAVLLRRALSPMHWAWYGLLGILLGLGALTKVTFLPVAVAALAWLGWLGWRCGGSGERWRTWGGALLAGLLFALFSAGWYLRNLLERGSLTGLVELSEEGTGGALFWLNAFAHPFELIKGLLGMLMTFVWGASASSAYPPVWSVLPLVLPVLVLLPLSLLLLRRPASEAVVLALLMVGAVGAGLVYYLLVRVAATGVGAGAPGWYLHTLVGPLSLLLAGGWSLIRERVRLAPLLARVWIGYAFCFCLTVAWLQLALFSGCAFKTAERRIYSFDDVSCLGELPRLYANLDTLAYPAAGLALSFLVAAMMVLAWRWRDRRSLEPR
ncbi:hypothetical protein [Stutzerimonas tarimensis]|uniref:Glycosyltransferase RgtA/B/C/D-like domain-containing protein n=1 Tax=Stutzerimonas tarimensis TaxID=1507735 RepID=A0ABV7T6W7_9GAMM